MMEKNTIEQYKEGNRISDEADENRIWGKSETTVSIPPKFLFYKFFLLLKSILFN